MIEKEDVDRVLASAEDRLHQAAATAEARIEDTARRANAELDRFDERATAEVNRWDGKDWEKVAVGLVLVFVLGMVVGNATADEPIGVPGAHCTLIDSDTGELATAASSRVECVATPEQDEAPRP